MNSLCSPPHWGILWNPVSPTETSDALSLIIYEESLKGCSEAAGAGGAAQMTRCCQQVIGALGFFWSHLLHLSGWEEQPPQAVLNHCLWTGGVALKSSAAPAVGSGQLLWFPQASGSVNAFKFIYTQVLSSPWLWSYPANAGAGLSLGKVEIFRMRFGKYLTSHSTYCQGTLGFITGMCLSWQGLFMELLTFRRCPLLLHWRPDVLHHIPVSLLCAPPELLLSCYLFPHTHKDGLSRTWQGR